eukprot:g19577.t1
MKASVASLIAAAGVVSCCSSCASAFVVPSAAVRAGQAAAAARQASSAAATRNSRRTMRLSAEKKEEEEDQEPMDLDLEQMFEVFEAADKEVSDEEVGKKGDKKAAGGAAKDPAEAMGDMLSSFFGGEKK